MADALACQICLHRRTCQLRAAAPALLTVLSTGAPAPTGTPLPMPCGGVYFQQDPLAPLPKAWRRDPRARRTWDPQRGWQVVNDPSLPGAAPNGGSARPDGLRRPGLDD